MWTSLFGLSLIITLNLLPLTHSTHPKLYVRGGNSCMSVLCGMSYFRKVAILSGVAP